MRLNVHNITRTDVRVDPGGTVVVRLWVDDHDETLSDANLFFGSRSDAVAVLGRMFADAIDLEDPADVLGFPCVGSELPSNGEAVTAP